MGIMSALSVLDSVGITKAELAAATKEASRAAVVAKTREVAEYWRSIAPVSDKPEHDVYGEKVGPGTYQDAVKIRFEQKNGQLVGVVENRAPHARFVEYGTVKMRAQGIAQRVVDHFADTEMGVSTSAQYLTAQYLRPLPRVRFF